jgi:hypothetical protein
VGKYQEALTDARAVLARRVTPQAAHGGVCKLCHWHSFCIDQLAGGRHTIASSPLRCQKEALCAVDRAWGRPPALPGDAAPARTLF